MICFDYEGFFHPDEVGPPVLDRFEYPQEFEVVGVVVLLGGGERRRVVCDRMSLPWGDPLGSPVLGEYGTHPVL